MQMFSVNLDTSVLLFNCLILVPMPKGEVQKVRDVVQYCSLHDFDAANANPRTFVIFNTRIIRLFRSNTE